MQCGRESKGLFCEIEDLGFNWFVILADGETYGMIAPPLYPFISPQTHLKMFITITNFTF